MMANVIIPVLNEAETIHQVMNRFFTCPNIGKIVVVVDKESSDDTRYELPGWEDWPDVRIVDSLYHGKGENILLGLEYVPLDQRVILCDGDLTYGPWDNQINWLIHTSRPALRIVVPRRPTIQEWTKKGPGHSYHRAMLAWPMVSGIRSAPARWLKNIPLTGYLTEVQINTQAIKEGMPIEYLEASEIISPLRFTPQRMKDMERDYLKGIEMGLLHDE